MRTTSSHEAHRIHPTSDIFVIHKKAPLLSIPPIPGTKNPSLELISDKYVTITRDFLLLNFNQQHNLSDKSTSALPSLRFGTKIEYIMSVTSAGVD
jgi:hypothetical protein